MYPEMGAPRNQPRDFVGKHQRRRENKGPFAYPRITPTHARTHTHPHTHASHTFTHTHTHSLSLSLAHAHTYTYTSGYVPVDLNS